MAKNADAEVVRLTNTLASAIRQSHWKQRDIEKALGMSSGSMSRLLSGGIELKLKHVLQICEVIGFPVSRFFHASYPTADEGGSQAARMQRLLAELHPIPEEPPAPPPPPAAPAESAQMAEIERMVFEAMTKFFQNLGGSPPPPQPPPPAPPPPKNPTRK